MIKNIITFVILYAVHAANVIADDIEIYQSGDFGVRPNVMFLLDTSGSMEETVEFSKGPYDPDTTYPGPFRTDRYYFKAQNIFVSFFDEFLDWDAEFLRKAMIDNHFPAEAFKCQTLESNLLRYGYVKEQFLQWDPNQAFKTGWTKWWEFHQTADRQGVWKEVKQTSDSDTDRYVDCRLDINNNHGLDINDNTYMTHYENGDAYSSNKSLAIAGGNSFPYDNLLGGLFKNNNSFTGADGRGFWTGFANIFKSGYSKKVILTGNYLNYDYYTGADEVTEASRMYIMGAAIAEAVGTNPGLNVGLSRFDGRILDAHGGMVSIPMGKSEDLAKTFGDTIKEWDPLGWTPMSESYYEVARYMRGEAPVFGNSTKGRTLTGKLFGDLIPKDMHSVPESKVNNNSGNAYQSPITESCQGNHIIVFSDGEPTKDIEANDAIQTLVSATSLPEDLHKNCSGNGQCSDELAYFLANTDQINDGDIEGIQSITTHTVGGFITSDQSVTTDAILKNMAKYGEGTYASISSYEEMRRAFSDILGGVLQNPVSFTAPVVSVNAFNSLELSDELYYSVFEPRNNLSWAGNLKRYRLGTLEVDGETIPAIIDANGDNAMSEKGNFFDEKAQSFWSPEIDGAVVTSGGMANRLTARNVLTSKAGSSALTGLSTVEASQLNIADKTASNPDYMAGLVAWANGFDVNVREDDGSFATPRKSMEDPLHSEPTIIKYSSSISGSGVKSADRTLFIGTNSGFVHAFDVNETNPKEHFSFIPKELLQNLDKYYSGGTLFEHKAYGVDGPLTHWHQDSNGNGQVDNGEQVYLYITMRRGGQSLYALNVTDRTAPTLAWQKHGNYPADFPNKPAVSADYSNLGQTWARMEPATVMWDNEQKVVLFTAGGYDPVEDGTDMDGPTSRSTHTQGTTIYMIDAIDGSVLWDASEHTNMPSDMAMTSSFAANVSPIDTSGDGLANMIYASDVGGRIWRFDITQPKIDSSLEDSFESTKGTFANGAAIFDASGGDGTGNRRFFNEVDVVYQKSKKGTDDSVLLSIGSGMRPHPLSTAVTNYHFVIKDELKAPETIDDYRTITFDQLTEYGTTNPYGWYVPLSYPGEKILARSNTFSDYILFSTFAPKEISTTTVNCDADPGRSMMYILNDGVKEGFVIGGGNIPPSPTIIEVPLPESDESSKKNKRSTPNVIVGNEVVMKANKVTGNIEAIEVGDEFNTSKDYWLEIARPEVEDIYEETTDE